ncbi:protein phosphatase 1 regulatory subunit 3E-like, partial [Scleropages formosus]
MDNEPARSVAVMLPPNNCIPRNYSCMAGLFGSLAAAANQRKEDGEEEGDAGASDAGALDGSSSSNQVVDERPRGRECFLKPPQSPTLRRRCKSLPTPVERARLEIARSRSPSSQKKVRFADSLGLELTSVKHFCDADMPEFENPGEAPGFLERVRELRVCLERADADEFSLSGLVRVLNVAFEKRVLLRYTLNNWVTFFDVPACYVPQSSDGFTDQFSFKIITPAFLESGG